MSRRSPGQHRDQALRRARSAARWSVVRRAAAEDADRAEAARRAGLTAAGLATLLYRHRGSTAWPFLEQDHG